MYSNVVLRVFNNPANAGRISKPDGIADNYNADETAHVEFSLRIESGIITECKFRAQANPYIIAICSTMTTMVKGKMVAMMFLDPYSIKNQLGDESSDDITFCIDCLKMAIDDYKEKMEKSGKKLAKTEILTEKNTEEALEIEEAETTEEESKEETVQESTSSTEIDFSDFFDDFDE